MKLASVAAVCVFALSFLASAEAATKPSIEITRPLAEKSILAGQPFTIAGKTTPGAEISSVLVKVAGQTFSPIGTNRWKVGATIDQPGRYKIVAIALVGQKRVARATRFVLIVETER